VYLSQHVKELHHAHISALYYFFCYRPVKAHNSLGRGNISEMCGFPVRERGCCENSQLAHGLLVSQISHFAQARDGGDLAIWPLHNLFRGAKRDNDVGGLEDGK